MNTLAALPHTPPSPASHQPDAQVLCPECRRFSGYIAAVKRSVVVGLLCCPHCEIGSPLGEWKWNPI